MGWWLLPQTWSIEIYDGFFFRPWRLQLILHTLPGLLAAVLFNLLPESPKFLVAQGRTEEALAVVKWIHMKNSGGKLAEMDVTELTSEASGIQHNGGCLKSMWNQTVPLFTYPYVVRFVVFCLIQFGIFYTCAGVGLWFPEIVNRILQVKTEESRTVCQMLDFAPNVTHLELQEEVCDDSIDTDTFVYNLFYGTIYVVGYIILGFLVKYFGRRTLLVGLLGSSAFVGLSLMWLTNHSATILFLAMHLMFAGVSISVVNSSVVAFFPTHMRAMAMCITLMFGRLGTFAGSNIIGYLFDINCHFTFLISVGLMILCSTAAFFIK
uniref:Putative synaptic vesicle transporter svop n=1 Tax=Lutzomyia longipalpis TaxID=7200 RepID=A0A7G3AZJ8_LUTLO